MRDITVLQALLGLTQSCVLRVIIVLLEPVLRFLVLQDLMEIWLDKHIVRCVRVDSIVPSDV